MRRMKLMGVSERFWWVLPLLAVAVVGCRSPLDGSDGPFAQWIDRDPASWDVIEGSSTHTRDTLASTEPDESAARIPPDAGPGDYVRLALMRNPAIKAAEQRMQRFTQRLPQVQSLDDPMLMVAPIGEMAETAAGMVGVMAGVSQKLPFPGKLGTRGDIAAQDVAMAVQDLQNTRLSVMADTRRAFWSYYFSTRALEVIEADQELLAQFKQIAEAKYESGTATQQDVLRASVELSNLENELITFRQRQTTARSMLNSQLDRPVDAPLPLPELVALQDISLRLHDLLADAAEANPQLRKIRERIEAYRQRMKLARLGRWPDLTVGLSYNAVDDEGLSGAANGDDQWWVSFGLNLPIWVEKLDAAEREARRGIFEGVADLTNERNRVAFRVQDGLIKVETQQRLVLLFRDVIVPQARQTVEVSESSYRAGKVDFLTLADNWRKLLDFELMYHRSLSRLEQDFADLQQVVGRDLRRRPGDGALDQQPQDHE